ncbi:MAG TPA: mitochondrial fission ELM1 family protein [Alphaproteobacteria bacterium]|nr:mitochondrial fission ELM1 family protein [Alphaproteobacteria bacterium]
MSENKTCWIITEGMAGTENQCIAVAEALGIEPEIIRMGLKQPWKTLSPWLGFEGNYSFTENLNPPWPDILIAAGRKSVAPSRYIKKQSGGKTFTVQLQDPKTSPSQFDLVAVPFHDKLRGSNVLVTDGAPNRITEAKLAAAKEQFSPNFKDFPSPRVAVLIGGNSKTHSLTTAIMQKLVSDLNKLEASLMITASRRTGEVNLSLLQEGLKNRQNIYIWDGNGDNPYFGMLGWADHILVTADSVSMLSDAGTTGKPVQMIELEGSSPRFDKFHNHLSDMGVIRPFDGNLADWEYEPLKDAQKIADKIEQAMQRRYG